MSENRIVFIGPDVMADSLLTGSLENRVVPASRVTLRGPRQERLEELHAKYGASTTTDNRAAAADAQVVILSVKPQMLTGACGDLHGAIPSEALVLSIVAGARLEALVQRLGHAAIVRAMPYTSAQVGVAITAWAVSPDVTVPQRELGRRILGLVGQEILVDDEDYLDMATAVSGTGPAYVFLFMEARVDAGVHLGLPRRIAEQLVVQTIKGWVAFYESSPAHMARLRSQVTSPGGTSAAARSIWRRPASERHYRGRSAPPTSVRCSSARVRHAVRSVTIEPRGPTACEVLDKKEPVRYHSRVDPRTCPGAALPCLVPSATCD